MSYADAGGYTMGLPQMPAMGGNGFNDSLPSLANHHQTMSARTSRSNSLMRPSSGVEDSAHRRSMSAMDFANNRMNFNDYRPDGVPMAMRNNSNSSPSPLPTDPIQTPTTTMTTPLQMVRWRRMA